MHGPPSGFRLVSRGDRGGSSSASGYKYCGKFPVILIPRLLLPGPYKRESSSGSGGEFDKIDGSGSVVDAGGEHPPVQRGVSNGSWVLNRGQPPAV